MYSRRIIYPEVRVQVILNEKTTADEFARYFGIPYEQMSEKVNFIT